MKIKIMLPVYASAMFEADIDVVGKTAEEIEDDFLDNCRECDTLCFQCARTIETDFTINFDNLSHVGTEICRQIEENS